MNDMTPAEQEHWDHVAGSASEFQNCFSEARSACFHLHVKNADLIAEALARGLFVVVKDCLYHCKATDAVAGQYIRFVQALDNITDARALANSSNFQNSDSSDPEDYSYRVVGDRQFVPPAQPVAASEEDLPF